MPDSLNVNLLLDPIELRIQVLPQALKQTVREKLKAFQDSLLQRGSEYSKVINDIENILSFLNEADMSDQLPLFRKNTLTLDSLRKENFLETFPELAELFFE